MQIKSVAIAIASFALTTAVPISQPTAIEARKVSSPFALESKVIPGIKDCGTNKTGLYVVSYHTGAGEGIAALADKQDSFYLNQTDSSIYFDYTGSAGPWPFAAEYAPYRAYNEISISIASELPPTSGLFFNSSGLQYNETFGGWLACDSGYESPQLFIINGPDNGPLPTSCSRVQLFPVPMKSS